MTQQIFPINVVIDTNILVSALWSEQGKPAKILTLIINDLLIPCYNAAIIQEYKNVLARPRFTFHQKKDSVDIIIGKITTDGLSIVVQASSISFVDENDRVFYDVAKASGAYLITGNSKHYPSEPFILSPSQFLTLLDI
jgi:putative PIN family toxin of toxin-antitoxin system